MPCYQDPGPSKDYFCQDIHVYKIDLEKVKHQLDLTTEALCFLMKRLEKESLYNELPKKLLEWHEKHKEYDKKCNNHPAPHSDGFITE